MRIVVAIVVAVLAGAAWGHDVAPASAATAARMRAAAERLLAALPPAARDKVTRPFDDGDRLDWHYTPRSRNGVALKELDARGRDAVHALLEEALSATGYRKAVNIIELELVLREIETFGLMRDPERYHLTIYGPPARAAAWGWRFEGHHLSLNFTLAGDHLAVDTPSFFGANPAQVRRGRAPDCGCSRPRRTKRARCSNRCPARSAPARCSMPAATAISSRANAPRAEPPPPAGIAAAQLSAAQKAQLAKLIDVYASTFEPALAEARKARVAEGGLDDVRFGWAGAVERGRPHYYRVQGPRFVIEYDASQDGGNHIRTVWRDFDGDFGRDLLREHYEAAKGTAHRH